MVRDGLLMIGSVSGYGAAGGEVLWLSDGEVWFPGAGGFSLLLGGK